MGRGEMLFQEEFNFFPYRPEPLLAALPFIFFPLAG
jgi:hypothetical protein